MIRRQEPKTIIPMKKIRELMLMYYFKYLTY